MLCMSAYDFWHFSRLRGSKNTVICVTQPLTHQHYHPDYHHYHHQRCGSWLTQNDNVTYSRCVQICAVENRLQNWFRTARKQEREDSGNWRRINQSHPGEAWRTGGLTGWHPKDPSKHKRPGRGAESSIDFVKKRLAQAKQLQNTGEVHVKGHSVFHRDYTPLPPPRMNNTSSLP